MYNTVTNTHTPSNIRDYTNQTLIINGNNFNSLESFYDEIDRVLTKGLDWKTGHNLNAFNDLLRGGFGVHDYEEPITIIWKNSNKSKTDMLFEANFDIVVEIIHSHEHIALILD